MQQWGEPQQHAQAAQQSIGFGLACASDVHGTAVPGTRQQDVRTDGKSTGALRCEQFDGDVALIVKHRHIQIMGVCRVVSQQDIGAHGAADAKP